MQTQSGNRAHSAYHLVRLYGHNEPRRAIFLRSEGKEGLLDGDPREEEVTEATNDDNSVVALHPDTIELLQLSHNTRILSGLP